MREKIGNILLELGITPELKGFLYIIDMVQMIIDEKCGKITELYNAVGEKNKVNASKIERGIRTAIQIRIDINSEKYKDFMGVAPKKMTNSFFVYTLAYKINEQEAKYGRNNNKKRI